MKPGRVKIKIFNKNGNIEESYIHVKSNFNDTTLCGEDMSGDDDREILHDVRWGKINCPRCIRTIKYCKAINDNLIGE